MPQSFGYPEIEILPIHFNVPGHYLPLATFIETTSKTAAIVQSLSSLLSADQAKFEIVVLPPDEGTFLARLGVSLVGGAGLIWGFISTDPGSAFVRGLTLHDPSYWMEQLGTYLREELFSPTIQSKSLARVETKIVTEAAKNFLQADQFNLRQAAIDPHNFRDGYEARNEFYKACAAEPAIKSLGFSEADDFPIKRSDFSRLQVALPPQEELLAPQAWAVDVVTLTVTSPNWDRKDLQRQWKGRDPNGREKFFRIEDQEFWDLVSSKMLNPHILDTMKVQWAYRPGYRNFRVLRVLQYNDQVLGLPLDDNALAAILGTHEDGDDEEQYLLSWDD